MSDLIVKLIEALRSIYHLVTFWVIVGDDELGLKRRLGVYTSNVAPGLSWKWPLIEEVLTCSSAWDATVIDTQTLTTADGKSVTVRAVLVWRVRDARKFILRCGDGESVLHDAGSGAVSELISTASLEEVLYNDNFDRDLTQVMRRRASKWGIDIQSANFCEKVQTRAYRLIQS